MTAKKANVSSWLDETAEVPVIAEKARRLESFVAALADGKVDDAEIAAQQARLVKLMKEIEPQLDVAMHAKITELLCEMAAYDVMQVLHSMQASRPKSKFRG